MASDSPNQNLSQYFTVCNDFIHAARLREGNVLIHCLAGMSRSVTVAVAYIMTVTNLNWKDALKVVRAGRSVANPNIGFQTQLQEFETYRLSEERRRLKERFPSSALENLDRDKCMMALDNYQELLQNKHICEGNCVKGAQCPTGGQMLDITSTNANNSGNSSSSTSSNANNSKLGENNDRILGYYLSFAIEQFRNSAGNSARTIAFNEAAQETSNEKSEEGHLDEGGMELMPNVWYYSPMTE